MTQTQTEFRSARKLRDCCDLQYILIGDLRDLLDDEPGEETQHWLQAVVGALLETLPQEFELKSRNGYLSEVLHEFPSWDTAVDNLGRRHVALHERLLELRERLTVGAAVDDMAGMLSIDLEAWVSAFTALQRDERRIVLQATTWEVGVGD